MVVSPDEFVSSSPSSDGDEVDLCLVWARTGLEGSIGLREVAFRVAALGLDISGVVVTVAVVIVDFLELVAFSVEFLRVVLGVDAAVVAAVVSGVVLGSCGKGLEIFEDEDPVFCQTLFALSWASLSSAICFSRSLSSSLSISVMFLWYSRSVATAFSHNNRTLVFVIPPRDDLSFSDTIDNSRSRSRDVI